MGLIAAICSFDNLDWCIRFAAAMFAFMRSSNGFRPLALPAPASATTGSHGGECEFLLGEGS